jgi:hypothetical protein
MATPIETNEERKKRQAEEAALKAQSQSTPVVKSLEEQYNERLGRVPNAFDPDSFANINRVGNDKRFTEAAAIKQQLLDSGSQQVAQSPQAEFTEAGKFGKGVRGALSSAYQTTLGGVNKYVSEPLINLPGQAANVGGAIVEAGAGLLGIPYNAGRYQYYTNRGQQQKQQTENKPSTETTSASKPSTETTSTSKPETKQTEEERAYSVVFPNNYSLNKVFNDKKEAEDYFESMGGSKGTPGGIVGSIGKDSQKRAENVAFGKQREDERSASLINTMNERRARAESEKKAGNESFSKFKADVAARRSALDAYNNYNNDMSLLNKAYREAKSKKNYGTAFAIKQRINRESIGVPQEEGAKQRFFESGQFAERELMRQQEARRLQEEEDNRRRLVASNPFAANYGFNRL